VSLITSKTVQGRLWFVNNHQLEERMLGYYAKYMEIFEVITYALVFHGSHTHHLSMFPGCNRAHFQRDFGARTSEAVRAFVPEFGSGHLFARRYAENPLGLPKDIEDRFFYCALQPVLAGLSERIGEYPGYNSVFDAINGIERKYPVVDWTGYKKAKAKGLKPKVKDFTTYYTLKFTRLPGYEHLSQKEYSKLMLAKLEKRRQKIVADWKAKGHVFMTKKQLSQVKPGSLPSNTKTSKRGDYRPTVLTTCAETKRAFLEWYFAIYAAYKEAVARYFAGELDVEFPPNTYRPPGLNIRR